MRKKREKASTAFLFNLFYIFLLNLVCME